MHFVYAVTKLGAYGEIVLFAEFPGLVLTEIVSVKTAFQRERIRHLELFPSDDAPCSHLVRLDSEATVLKIKQMGLLRHNTR
jgi:hypothetical protein